jgi:PAS domain S-box-containing protein/diguanylate cyclase (GGDEF)-like protein
MKLLNYTYQDNTSLEEFITNNITNYCYLMIQVFSGTDNIDLIKNVLKQLKLLLPDAKIIGASSSGEINQGTITQNKIVISFSMFKDTKIKLFHFDTTNYEDIKTLTNSFIKDETKAVIAFANSLTNSVEPFLDTLSMACPNMVLAGGNASDNDKFESVYLIKDDEIFYDGIVIATLNSKTLKAYVNYSFEWVALGKEMVITKADGNRVYEIDGIRADKIYTKYLGVDVLSNLPWSIADFPLIKSVDNTKVGRIALRKNSDGSILYAGSFKEGEKVRFAINNIEESINQSLLFQKQLTQNPVQANYIYSCSARRALLQDYLDYEINLINDVAPSTGFLTFGGLYQNYSKSQVLNVTTITLSLSEIDELPAISTQREYSLKNHTIKVLTQLVNETQKELDDSVKFLNQYKIALDSNSIVSKTDKRGRITYVNEEFCKISGYKEAELIGKDHNILRHPDNSKEFFKQMWDTITHKQIWRGIFKNLSKDGSTYYVKSAIVPILDENNEIIEYIATRTDVTELIQKEQIIKEQYTDDLTKLDNRTALISRLKHSKGLHTLVLFNLARFSDFNNYFGYDYGDKILIFFAQNLSNIAKDYQIFRTSGDEFAILFEKQNYSSCMVKDTINEIIKSLEKLNIDIEGISTNIPFSCGVAYGPHEVLYKLANMAIKEAKKSNESIIFYNESDLENESIKTNIETINKVRVAIEEDRIIPFFQGIVNNQTGKIEKYECLIRLKDIDGKILSPFFFLEHAKKAKLYEKLTAIMIKKSFLTFADTDFEFSINFSMQDISSKEIKQLLFDYLHKYKCANRVVLEIVESEGINNIDETLAFFKDVKDMGCKIAIDDFGTGYSNFEYLIKLNADYLKIDGSLIKNILDQKDSCSVVLTIVEFAKKLGLKTIAEFVENEKIYQALKNMGVDYSQGYHFSVPKGSI